MPPVMPLDIQWFVYAMVSNEAMTYDDARNIYRSLGVRASLEAFAQTALDRLCTGMSEEDAAAYAEQMQALLDYAAQQAESGAMPPHIGPAAPVTQVHAATGSAAAESAAAPEQRDDGGAAESSAAGRVMVEDSAVLQPLDFDYSTITSFEQLPGFSDVSELSDEELQQRMIFLLGCLRALGCSDLHISGGAPPFVRYMLEVVRIDSYVLTAEDARRLNFSLISEERRRRFEKQQDLNFALQIGNDRFRVALMEQKDGIGGSYRLVPDHICSLEELGFLDDAVVHLKRLLDYNNGLILLTGPIGSGKTTTLASMVDIINEKRQDHIITAEDPIEILQLSKNCRVTQREIGRHTAGYHAALKAALREDPDIIVIGEMHDLETIEKAITASETGHLVIGTLHTSDAPNTLNRMLDVFPPSQQAQIRAMTAGSLRGVICQKLIADGFGGVTIVYEILLNNMSVANTINEGKTFRLKSTMATATKNGMCTMDQCILEKYKRGMLTREAALAHMTDSTIIEQLNQIWATEQAKQLGKK